MNELKHNQVAFTVKGTQSPVVVTIADSKPVLTDDQYANAVVTLQADLRYSEGSGQSGTDPKKADALMGKQNTAGASKGSIAGKLKDKMIEKFGANIDVRIHESYQSPDKRALLQQMGQEVLEVVAIGMEGEKQDDGRFKRMVKESLQEISQEMEGQQQAPANKADAVKGTTRHGWQR